MNRIMFFTLIGLSLAAYAMEQDSRSNENPVPDIYFVEGSAPFHQRARQQPQSQYDAALQALKDRYAIQKMWEHSIACIERCKDEEQPPISGYDEKFQKDSLMRFSADTAQQCLTIYLQNIVEHEERQSSQVLAYPSQSISSKQEE